MKQLLPLAATAAIAIGMAMFAEVEKDGSHAFPGLNGTPVIVEQTASTKDPRDQGNTVIQPVVQRATLPAANTRPFHAQFPVARPIEPQRDIPQRDIPQPDIPQLSTIKKQPPKKQWSVQQASYLEPVAPVSQIESLPSVVTSRQQFNEEESFFIADEAPPSELYVPETENIPRRLPRKSTPSSFVGEDKISKFVSTDENFQSFDNEIFYPETPAPINHGEFEVIDNLGAQNSADTWGNSFEGSHPVQPQIPNETEQIGALLQQIGNQRATNAAHELRWSLDDAIAAALTYSNRVSSLRIESVEALQNVGVEDGQFDVAAFVTQSFRDSAEPVGSSIDTASGTQAIVNENDLNVAYGLRQQLRSGGNLEVSQSYQFRDNDSGILIPADQAISRLNGRLTKELLRGAGRSIAMNQVLVAYHDASAQRAEVATGIADHLNEVMTAYWDIFAARGALFANMENRDLAVEVLRELNARRDIDAEPNLIAQSEATIRQRELQIIEAHSTLVKAQIEFISLVNAPELLDNSDNLEILPQVIPDFGDRHLDVASRINTAIQRRPEVGDIVERIRSAQVANHLSLNDLLPRLSLSLEASLNGLEGDNQLGTAINNQFENDLTYQVGVDFEVPLLNRRARFNKRRTELVVARLRADWQGLIQDVKADVLDNAQEFSASQLRLETQAQVLKFAADELRYLGLRKTVAPKESDNVSFALTQVLSAQNRQVEAKSDFVAAIADKYRAIFELNRATGILINPNVLPEDGGPARPGFFAVYHQYLEERGSFDGPLDCVQSHTFAKSEGCSCQSGAQSGVRCLKSNTCSCGSCAHQGQAVQPTCETCERSAGVIQTIAELPAVNTMPRYPLR